LASIHRAEPTGREVSFGVDELLVTKTDLNGRITYANQSFLRIAAYTESELVGQAHSVIRHPEMPRCVFHLLWSAIQSGKETFAYVVNLTKEGDHYWVFAHVTPTFDHKGSIIGYHSNRRAPDKEQVVRVKQVYDRLLAAERGFERNTDAIAASSKVLESLLAEQKKSYDEFVFSI
jgi:PAS domain S-box-containing protein